VSISHQTSLFALLLLIFAITTVKTYKKFLQLSLYTLELRDSGYQRLPISNPQPRTLVTTAFFEPFYALLSHHCTKHFPKLMTYWLAPTDCIHFSQLSFFFFQFLSRHIKMTLICIDVQRNCCDTARFLIIYFISCLFLTTALFSKSTRNAIVYFNVSGSILIKMVMAKC